MLFGQIAATMGLAWHFSQETKKGEAGAIRPAPLAFAPKRHGAQPGYRGLLREPAAPSQSGPCDAQFTIPRRGGIKGVRSVLFPSCKVTRFQKVEGSRQSRPIVIGRRRT